MVLVLAQANTGNKAASHSFSNISFLHMLSFQYLYKNLLCEGWLEVIGIVLCLNFSYFCLNQIQSLYLKCWILQKQNWLKENMKIFSLCVEDYC